MPASGVTTTQLSQTAPDLLHETRFTHLRRLATEAKSALNAWNYGYMKSQPGWQPGQAVVAGQCVVVNAQIIVYVTPGTTGQFPPTTFTNARVADGTANYTTWTGNSITTDPLTLQAPWAPSTAQTLGNQVYNTSNYIYSCIATTLYVFTVSGDTTVPTVGSKYTNNGQSFYPLATNVTSGSGTITCSGTGAPAASGNLTYVSGTGQSPTIAFSSVVTNTTTAGSGGPTGTGVVIIDSGVAWTFMGLLTQNPLGSEMPTISYSGSQPSGLTSVYSPGSGASGRYVVAVTPCNPGHGYQVGDTIHCGTSTAAFAINTTAINTAGSSYATGDTGYINGGTYSIQARYVILAQSGGVPSQVGIYDCGLYTAGPGPSPTTTAITGSGTGLVLNVTNGVPPSSATTEAILTVATVNGSGGVTGYTITNPGNYATLGQCPNWAYSTSGSGLGCTFAIHWSPPYWCNILNGYVAGNFDGNTAHGSVVYTVQGAAIAVPVPDSWSVQFMTDAIKFWIYSPVSQPSVGNGGVGLLIDGKRYSLSTIYSSTSTGYYLIDFTLAGGAKKRKIQIDYNCCLNNTGFALSQVGVDSNSQVWAPDECDAIRAVSIWDSYGAGSNSFPYVSNNTYWFRLAQEMGWLQVYPLAIGGTGWDIQGGNSANFGYTTDYFSTRIAQLLALNPDVIILQGSVNDYLQTTAITTNIITALGQIRNGTGGYPGSTAPIFFFGVTPVDGNRAPSEIYTQAGVLSNNYVFTVSSANATIAATFTNNGQTFTVLQTIAAGTALVCSGTGAPGASGTLTKASGTGDSTITFSAVTTPWVDPLGLTWYFPRSLPLTGYPDITGSYNNNPFPSGITNTNSTNFNEYISSYDSVHPLDRGVEYLAKRDALRIKSVLNSVN